VNIINNTLDYYIDKLKTNKKFSFTRWGDGEWGCSFGVQGQNCDSHIYYSQLKDGLNESLNNPKGYMLATWPQDEPMMTKIWQDVTQRVSHIKNWYNASVWEEDAMNGKLKPLIEQLETMNFIIVSELSKKSLPIKYTDYIEIPSVNCFLEKDRIKKEMISMCDKYDSPVFGLSASMATNVMVDELYHEIGDRCWMIDLGSIWEPYIGKVTRSYHHRYVKTEF